MEQINTCAICGKGNFSVYLESSDYFLSKEKFTIVTCDNCEFLFLNPRPDAVEISKYYKSEEYISHSNTKRGVINKVYHIVRKRNHKKKYNLIQNLKNKGTLLDIGCATGEFINYCRNNGWTVAGVEPDEDAQKFAKTQYNLNVYPESLLKEIPTNKFDVISMWHVLEHVHLLEQRIGQLKIYLKNDGVAIIAVPNAACKDAEIYKEFWAGYDLPRHLYHFTKKSILELFKKNNFALIETIPMKFDSYYISMLSEKYKTGTGNVVKAFLNGYKSNRWAKRNNNNYSSQIFILKKNNVK